MLRMEHLSTKSAIFLQSLETHPLPLYLKKISVLSVAFPREKNKDISFGTNDATYKMQGSFSLIFPFSLMTSMDNLKIFVSIK